MTNSRSIKTAYLYNDHLFADAENLLFFGGVLPQHAGRVEVPADLQPGQPLYLAHRYDGAARVVGKLDQRTIASMAGRVSHIHSTRIYAESFC